MGVCREAGTRNEQHLQWMAHKTAVLQIQDRFLPVRNTWRAHLFLHHHQQKRTKTLLPLHPSTRTTCIRCSGQKEQLIRFSSDASATVQVPQRYAYVYWCSADDVLSSIGDQTRKRTEATTLRTSPIHFSTERTAILDGSSLTSNLHNKTFFVEVFLFVFFTGASAGPVRPRLSGFPPCSQMMWTVLHLFFWSRFGFAFSE